METILGGVAVCGIVAVIALGAREELPRGPAGRAPTTLFPEQVAAPAGSATAPEAAGGVPAAPAVEAMPATSAAGAGVRAAEVVPATGGTPEAKDAAASNQPSPGTPAGGASRAVTQAAAPQASGPPSATPASGEVETDTGLARPAAQADARALLRATEAAYGRVRSLRADFVQVVRNPLLGTTITSRGTLFERRPDRFLMRFSDPAGDELVSDGQYFWVYYPSVDAKQVIRMPATAGRGGADLQAQFLGDAGRRFAPAREGTETVGGRRLSILRLVPRSAAPYKQLKLWIDPADHMARRIEITEENGSVRRVDLSNLRVNAPLADAVFRFRPPAGAHVVDRS